MGIAPGGGVGRLLRIADRLRGGAAALEMDRELGGDLPGPRAIPRLQPHANASVQLPPPRRPDLVIQDLLVQGMLKAVAAPARAIRPHRQPRIVEEVLLRRQSLTHRLDVLHGHLAARGHGRHRKHLAHHAGRLQHPTDRGRQRLEASQEQLPQPLGQTRHLGLGPVLQGPLPRTTDHEPLADEVLHDVHQEERIPLRALEDERREGAGDRPPQAPGHIRRHRLGGQEFQPHVHRLPAPTQLLEEATHGRRPEHHLHRPIRPQQQQPRGGPPLRQIGQGLHGGGITPLQVFEHQHQRRVGRQDVERLGQLPQHPGRGRPLDVAAAGAPARPR